MSCFHTTPWVWRNEFRHILNIWMKGVSNEHFLGIRQNLMKQYQTNTILIGNHHLLKFRKQPVTIASFCRKQPFAKFLADTKHQSSETDDFTELVPLQKIWFFQWWPQKWRRFQWKSWDCDTLDTLDLQSCKWRSFQWDSLPKMAMSWWFSSKRCLLSRSELGRPEAYYVSLREDVYIGYI